MAEAKVMLMKESVLEKFEQEMELEGDELLRRNYFIVGVDYSNEDNLDDALFDAMEAFCKRYNLSEKTLDELLNSILARDAYYQMMYREGFLKDSEENVRT